MIRSILEYLGIAGIAFFLGAIVAAHPKPLGEPALIAPRSQTVELSASLPVTEDSMIDEIIAEEPVPGPTPKPKEKPPSRLFEIYGSPPLSLETVYSRARDAVVNIVCRSDASSAPISGSGVIIDPKGVILTNAHVAQYVLLSMHPNINLTCMIRSGSPATDIGEAQLLYIPSRWVYEHARDIQNSRPLGTGERDYAFLVIRSDNLQIFPFLPVDTRENIAMTEDSVLLAAYPAEFTQSTIDNFNVSTSLATIIRILTFSEKTIDLLSLRGVTVAQSGASGGAVVNEWGQLVGIISTKSAGETSVERDLRAITASYINRSLNADTGLNLAAFLNRDVSRETQVYSTIASDLANALYGELK